MVLDVTAAKAVLERNVAYRVVRMAVQVLLGKNRGNFAVSSSASTDQDHRTDCRPQVTGVNLLMPLVEPKRPRAGCLSMSLVAQAKYRSNLLTFHVSRVGFRQGIFGSRGRFWVTGVLVHGSKYQDYVII